MRFRKGSKALDYYFRPFHSAFRFIPESIVEFHVILDERSVTVMICVSEMWAHFIRKLLQEILLCFVVTLSSLCENFPR